MRYKGLHCETMMDAIDTEAEVEFLRRWAADNKAYFEDAGEVGFGRECVGIVKGHEYPAYNAFHMKGTEVVVDHECREASPPAGAPHAYHKHDCLAVLGRGPDAIHELYLWVKQLEERGIVIEERTRAGNRDVFTLALHGPTQAILMKR